MAPGAMVARMKEDPGDEAQFSTVDLDRTECLELLRTARIGRVVLSVDCLPVALPVNLAVSGDDVVFSTNVGVKTDAAVAGRVVSVEIDDIDAIYHTGWSVLATGVARVVTDEAEIAALASRLRPWAAGPHPFLIKVPSTLISGRRLTWSAVQKVEPHRP